MSNTQLTDEALQSIEEAANNYVEETRGRSGRVETYIAGATEYAIKLNQAQQTIKVLEYDNKQLKGELEGYKAACDELKQHEQARALLEKVIHRHEGGLLPDRFIYNEIKQYLDGKK